MVKNRFVVEVGDTEQLKQCIARLRNVESVFDAYRVTPSRLSRRSGDDRQRAGLDAQLEPGLLADVVAVDLDRERARRAVLVLEIEVTAASVTSSKCSIWRWLGGASASR